MTSCELLCKDNEIGTQGVNKKTKVVLVHYLCDRVDFCDAIVLWFHLPVFSLGAVGMSCINSLAKT